jgi:hypothetical protein
VSIIVPTIIDTANDKIPGIKMEKVAYTINSNGEISKSAKEIADDHETTLSSHATKLAAHDTALATHTQNITDLAASVGTKADKTVLTTIDNKIGDLNGLEETDLASAVKKDRSQLSDISNYFLDSNIDCGLFADTSEGLNINGGDF